MRVDLRRIECSVAVAEQLSFTGLEILQGQGACDLARPSRTQWFGVVNGCLPGVELAATRIARRRQHDSELLGVLREKGTSCWCPACGSGGPGYRR